MKKFALIPVLVIILVCFGAAGAKGTFSYSVLPDDTAEISDCEGTATKLEIPYQLDGYAVTAIENEAFAACPSLVITASEGSYAAQFAEENDIPLIIIP